MCVVSVVNQYMRDYVSPAVWTTSSFNEYQEIIRRLEALDKRFNQPECDDPSKSAWMKAIEERLKALEGA